LLLPLLLLLLVLYKSQPPKNPVILSEAEHSTIVLCAVEGPAVAFAFVVAFALAVPIAPPRSGRHRHRSYR
jgi:hypothetical protein